MDDHAAIAVRSATPQDLSAITEILVSHPERVFLHHEYNYLMKMRHFPETCLIAEIDGQPAGIIFAYPIGAANERLFIWQIAVAKKFMRCGVGSKLFDLALKNAEARGCRKVEGSIPSAASRKLIERFARSRGKTVQQTGEITFRNPLSGALEVEPLYEIELDGGPEARV